MSKTVTRKLLALEAGKTYVVTVDARDQIFRDICESLANAAKMAECNIKIIPVSMSDSVKFVEEVTETTK